MNQAVMRLTEEDERGSGRQSSAPEPRYLVVGQIVAPHGVRGEIKVELLTQDPHRFRLLEQVLIGAEDAEPRPWPLEGYRIHKGRALLRLAGCHDRDTAEGLRGLLVQVPIEEAVPLEEGEYYEHQILGLEVYAAGGECLGSIVEILYTGANEVYVVRGPAPGRREILIPAIESVVLEVDLAAGRLTVELPPGL